MTQEMLNGDTVGYGLMCCMMMEMEMTSRATRSDATIYFDACVIDDFRSSIHDDVRHCAAIGANFA